jgi:DNA-binding transcriptional LysR family regulator
LGADHRPISATAFVSLPGDSRIRRIIDAAAAAHDLVLNHVVTVTQFATLMSLVQAGVGVAIVPGGAWWWERATPPPSARSLLSQVVVEIDDAHFRNHAVAAGLRRHRRSAALGSA